VARRAAVASAAAALTASLLSGCSSPHHAPSDLNAVRNLNTVPTTNAAKSPGSTDAATPSTTAPPAYTGNPYTAVTLEGTIQSLVGGCWQEAGPANPDGAYRQDFYYTVTSACEGSDWAIDMQIFASDAAAKTASGHVPDGDIYDLTTNTLVVLTPRASPSLRALTKKLVDSWTGSYLG